MARKIIVPAFLSESDYEAKLPEFPLLNILIVSDFEFEFRISNSVFEFRAQGATFSGLEFPLVDRPDLGYLGNRCPLLRLSLCSFSHRDCDLLRPAIARRDHFRSREAS